ncbi:MAG: GrpB family protein [Candidatus Binatia bacterium]
MIDDLRALNAQQSKATRQAGKRSGIHHPAMIIGTYTPSTVEYLPHDSESRRVARWIADMIAESDDSLHVEHIGSTSVPGCWGKGIIDLLVQYSPGCLAAARKSLDRIGFQRQAGVEAFPESRPMRVGRAQYFGRAYRIHAHVVARGSSEARDLARFRDLLREDICLRRAYEGEKRVILARGIVKGNEYSNAKGEFIRRALAADQLESSGLDPAMINER